MLYSRHIFQKLEAELETKEVTVITGMRRVGKTTALTHLYDLVSSANKAIIDLENPLYRKIFEEENYDNIWNNLKSFGIHNSTKSYLFLDEVQNLPEISKVIKYLYDHWDIKVVLTGSSSYYLINLFPESLASRIEITKLANDLSVSRETVYNYLSFLEHTYFISLLPRHSASIDRQAAGTKKLFLCDSGIANMLGRISQGQLLEQSIFQTLRTQHALSFYNKDGKNEIDFIINEKIALEVKNSASRQDIATLRKRAKAIKVPEYYIVSKQFSEEREDVVATDL